MIRDFTGTPSYERLPSQARTIAVSLLVLALAITAWPLPDLLAQSNASTTWAVSIVLPPKLVAGKTATFAVLGTDGRLAEGIPITVGDLKIRTDNTGRGSFTVPQGVPVVIATGSGDSAAALVDAVTPPGATPSLLIAPVVSLSDEFSICGGEFLDDPDANRVSINNEKAFVLAASPECLAVLASPRTLPGPAQISVENSAGVWKGATTLVSLHFDPPIPALTPGKKSRLAVHVQGSDRPIHVSVENRTPGVLRFLHGDVEDLVTSGGPENSAGVSIEAVSTGEFSFRARVLPAPDSVVARRYLVAAEPLAPKDWQSRIKGYAHDLERNPQNTAKMSHELQMISAGTSAGDFKTLLDAARSALR
jgi:hypothetical protein